MSDDRDYGNTNFSVARMSYDIGKQSTVGLISTYGNTNDSIQNGVAGVDLKLATSTFKRDKNVSLDLFILKSVTDKLHGKNYSWGATFAYPNDLIDFQLGHVQIGKNFHTGIGYVSRTNIKETFGSLMIEPRLNSMGVRQLFFGGSFDYVTDFSHKPETRSFGFTPFSILFESGERFTYSLNRRYDHFDQDFNIFSHFIIPANEYKWWENQLSLFTEGSRKLSGRLSYGFGDFYTGQKNNLSVSANWKIAVPFMISSSITTNQIKLPDGKFNTHIFEFNLNWLFSPDITVYNSFQYDNLSEIAGWQSRFQWILSPGNEILFVWNSSFLKTLNSYSWDEAGLRFKVKYNIRL
ncbi:MAG: hypothetical protein GX126_02195 [Bacteroidales bacterium]|jgi:hypothetical protein|nr:hypothetical protein [Bacteroidales bacterium]NLY24553.1 hypothetical protein [Bacteroidales bacterium]